MTFEKDYRKLFLDMGARRMNMKSQEPPSVELGQQIVPIRKVTLHPSGRQIHRL